MRIAIPLVQGQFSLHFGHCDEFAVVEVDIENKKVINTENVTPPAHEPGVLPKWLNGLGVNLVIAGGMGQRAQMLLKQFQIDVITAVAPDTPEQLALNYMNDTLTMGENICDH
jgi:predicted Fe-Mo cluster-binding NifX family protein